MLRQRGEAVRMDVNQIHALHSARGQELFRKSRLLTGIGADPGIGPDRSDHLQDHLAIFREFLARHVTPNLVADFKDVLLGGQFGELTLQPLLIRRLHRHRALVPGFLIFLFPFLETSVAGGVEHRFRKTLNFEHDQHGIF